MRFSRLMRGLTQCSNRINYVKSSNMESECQLGVLDIHSPTCQLVDVFTKPLGNEAFSTMMRKLGVLDIHSPT
ncbi:hypothetical protein CK203_036412 [Vitis vinifera]|uniref:Uncharacterized protein n=1 Tax=Vitis vinifera TaxID=29760 RepID=A0A438HYP6_VITVI|nr:hypothetical protein CK203_036412 [Vitis vinifera]